MARFEIQEPAKRQIRPAMGIDLGTTHSLVAIDNNGHIEVLSDEADTYLVPSVVRFLSEAEVVVGESALAAIENDPQNVVASVKRKLLEPAIVLEKTTVSPVKVSAHILAKMRQIALRFDKNLQDAVITVPAYFDEVQRQATLEAAKIAGLNVLRLLNEPTAAALAYGLEKQTRGYCLVYDLGGGTFDVSLLQLNQGVFEVLATGGDTALGGDDIDILLADYLRQEANFSAKDKYDGALLLQARKIKEQLSLVESCHVILANGWQGKIERATLEQLIAPIITRTLAICSQVLKDAKIEKKDIAHVILVGGSTRVKAIANEVERYFGQKPLQSLDPDKVVAMGAAIQARILSGIKREDSPLLLDVIPLSLGMEMMGGVVEKILMRNTSVPAVAVEQFTTYQDGQTGFTFHIVQGEREMAKDCRSLAHFELTGLPAARAGQVKIEVTFRVDVDGLLSVSAKELATQKQAAITIKPTYGLSQSEIKTMINDSIAHAHEDIAARKLQEKVNQAQKLVEMIATVSDPKLVDHQNTLEEAVKTGDFKHISQSLQTVEKTLECYFQEKLNANLKAIFNEELAVEESL